ncbi:SGNH/GDSL hydrolase family protein [Sulfitobacter albidus]|uniref:SGNH/GDSL hydrolase family protein n=1 Tax=Sulfitobacter albidus TaxID=2829501 RepID=A0A975PLH6_9RHOB|nr:SGNH/GDSL hydrolase family protein [Sulfitobacter albidus]QUJ75200.1 SGNH/GDSL hydrolase family protein [Sulfitobacter albidus]
MRRTPILALTLALAACTATRVEAPVAPVDLTAPPAPVPIAAAQGPTEILVLGDSQISFGAGGAYTRFFGALGANCAGLPPRYARAKAAAIGVRSSALHHWTAADGPARGTVCDVDPTFGVNAGAYGVTSPGRSYVQIGTDPAYPFCPTGRSPLQAVFDAPAHDPDLVVLAFLGNGAARWQSPATARADWAAARAQLPADVACLVMTTIPAYVPADNRRRAVAQGHLGDAVRASGRCAFVPGLTDTTLGAFENNPAHFRTDAAGTVTDPRHPTARSAARFFELQTPALCAALARALPN